MTRLVSLLVALPLALLLTGCEHDGRNCRATMAVAHTAHDSLVVALTTSGICYGYFQDDILKGKAHD